MGNITRILCAAFALLSAHASASQSVYEVKSFGAKADGTTLDTAAIQSAIDAASKAGGGNVHFGPGTYRTKLLTLKSDVTLKLDKGARLEASTDRADWNAQTPTPVITAVSCDDVGIEGDGTIDGGGLIFYGTDPKTQGVVLPGAHPESIIYFGNCTHVRVSGVTLRNSVKWTLVFEQCENVKADGVIIRNRAYCLSRETDGIDVEDCRHVVVENCDIQTGDDALCVKTDGDSFHQPPRPTYDLVFRNCTLATTCNATKIGTGTVGDTRDIHFSHITVNKLPSQGPPGDPTGNGSCVAAISVQSNDGGHTHDVTFSDYTVNDCDTPIFMEVQNMKREEGKPHAMGLVSDIMVSNFTCLHSWRASQINVEKGARLKNITLRNLTIHNFGTSTGPAFAGVPYLDGGYPDAHHYGDMPAFGLFARCVNGLSLAGQINFSDDGHSGRKPTVFEDVTQLQR